MNNNSASAGENIFRYVITESGKPTSLDPLEADNTNNLPVARMIYATPLEVNSENQISSHLLDSFKYEAATSTIHWLVKRGPHFDDGAPISATDIAFAVARMAYTRPSFPVLEDIEGINTWVKSKHPLKSLPTGITIDGQKISIRLNKIREHPLFRFCLELFSVIPKRCVDLETNALICKDIPASGHYRLIDKGADSYLFTKREGSTIDGLTVPEKIRFEYISSDDFPNKMAAFDRMTVVAGSEATFSPTEMSVIEKSLAIKFTPAARFSMLLLNPETEPFKNQKCRRFFAQKFRESYSEIVGKSTSMEASIFTKILPGYLSPAELESEVILSPQDISQCKAMLAKATIGWGYAASEKRSLFIDTLKKTAEKIGANLSEPTVLSSRKDMFSLFSNGKISIFSASSGFWALDPGGDVKMLFTPNLHEVLKFVSRDEEVQRLIGKLDSDASSFNKLNRHLFAEAHLNVYSHLRRFFAASDKETLADFPFAITSPAPWQVFKVK